MAARKAKRKSILCTEAQKHRHAPHVFLPLPSMRFLYLDALSTHEASKGSLEICVSIASIRIH